MAVTHDLAPNTLIESAKLDENFDDLATGDGDEPNNKMTTFRDEAFFDFVASGGVWTEDSPPSLNGDMTALVGYVDGIRFTVSAVNNRAFTASKDTYIDVGSDGILDYTEVANNAASPALASGHLRLAIVVTDGTEITNVNQGSPIEATPVASSIIYSVTDSLGNLIYNTNPYPKIIGYRQITSAFITSTSGSDVDITGLSMPFIIPTGRDRRIKISLFTPFFQSTHAAGSALELKIKEGATQKNKASMNSPVTNYAEHAEVKVIEQLVAGSYTYKGSIQQTGTGTLTITAGATFPTFIMAEFL